jgi:sugar/nucleoside kinase (ribokinase family)
LHEASHPIAPCFADRLAEPKHLCDYCNASIEGKFLAKLRKRPTIADVARTAGVSIGTVSNYLNGTAFVRPQTKGRIEGAINELTYRPSAVARSFAGGTATVRPNDHLSLPRLLAIGYISVDYLCRIDVLPHRDDRITAKHIEKALGSPAVKVAVVGAGIGEPYGLDVELATAVGHDPDSDWALAELSSRGVHALPIRQSFNNRLSRCIVLIEASGSRTIINEPFELNVIDLTANFEVKPGTRAAWLHIEGYHYERMIDSTDRFREAGWKVSLHSTGLPAASRTPAAFQDLVRSVDLIFINDVMLREIFDIRAPVASMVAQINKSLKALGPRDDAVLTLGELGAVVFPKSSSRPVRVPALPVDRIDATGAGDAFVGVFLSYWLHGENLETAARHGAVASSLTTTAEGAQGYISGFAELEAALATMTVKTIRTGDDTGVSA